jgi:hypothetical protein
VRFNEHHFEESTETNMKEATELTIKMRTSIKVGKGNTVTPKKEMRSKPKWRGDEEELRVTEKAKMMIIMMMNKHQMQTCNREEQSI